MSPVPPLSAITVVSLGHLAWALMWGILVFAAIAGYGAAFLRALGQRRPGWTIAATAGFGSAIFLGGLLNLFHAIFVPLLIAFVALGVLLAALLLFAGRNSDSTPSTVRPSAASVASRIMTTVFLLVCGFRLIATVHTPYYQNQDDYNFYLAAPVKMIEMHSFAPDPYSERRIMSSLGGNQFLNTLILATQPLEDVQMADRTLGLLLLALLAFALSSEFELTPLQRAVFATLVFITPQLQFNLTFVILPSALFFGLLHLAAHRRLTEEFPALQAVVMGAVVAAIASMKSTYVVHGVVFVLCIGLLRCWKRGVGACIRLVLLAALSCFVVLLPWMIASHADSGTWFYPMLGKGFHYSAYNQFPAPASFSTNILIRKVLPFSLPVLFIFLAEWIWGEKEERTYAAAALALAAFASSVLVGVATGGDSVRRYNYPCILPAIAVIYLVFALRANRSAGDTRWRLFEGAAAFIAIVSALLVGFNSFTLEYAWMGRSFMTSLTDFRIVPQSRSDEYTAIQAALPLQGEVLATVNDPFLFDYSRRNIFIADFAGAASPKPGWPARQSGEALAHFLLSQNVHYLIFDYNDCGLMPEYPDCSVMRRQESLNTIRDPNKTQWIRSENEIQLDSIRQYEELAGSRRHLYDDGKVYILDLNAPAASGNTQ